MATRPHLFAHHLKHTDIAKNEMISRVRAIYEDNMCRLEEIGLFENAYYSDDVINWYTTESFFYRGLNTALRSHDINEIFLWRFYISDLDRKLRELCSKQMDSQSKCVFRGQRLYTYNLRKLATSVGKLIAMTSFLSTTSDYHLAKIFAGNTPVGSPVQSVIYKIFIASNTNKIVCADISELSVCKEEDEYLFSIRSLFRIERIEYSDNIWCIDLTAVDEDDQQFCTVINPWKTKISEQSFFSGRHEPLFTRFLIDQNSSFLAFQLLTDIMLRLHQTDFARQEMIEMCRLKYENSLTDLDKINEFERSYQHSQAIEWYTTNSFLYRLLHQALIMEDIDTIFKLRYYIYDLHNQLVQLRTSYLDTLPSDQRILTLYRGQLYCIQMKFGIYLLLLANVAITLKTNNKATVENYPRPINHVGISVTDIDAAMAWYHDVLGFTVISTATDIIVNNSTSMGILLGQMYGREMKHVKMGHMTGGNGIGLEFFQFIDPPTQRPNITTNTNEQFEYTRAGFFHICVTDPNPESLVQQIVETGGKQLSPILSIIPNEIYQAVYCLDPFGNLVEIMSASYEQTLSNRDSKTTSISSSARRTI
ncbi:unnamed protein product [Adineta steineri]|uniref:VOC domain-containing protein n=1 Tax=Adineta steineri TaxID=433720 RepID=A0A815PUU8_9BILA|nr:unnamed protein product [Adineta steineri]